MVNMADYRFEMCKKSNMAKFEVALDKGLVDKMLIPFLKKINKRPNIYSSSCCAGRIMIIGLDTEESKKPNLFVLKEHRKVKFSEIKNALKTDKFPELWLKEEPFIFHFGAKDLETAKKFLEIKTKAGIRRGGIFHIKDNKYLIELIGSQTLAVPIKIGKKVLFSEEQIKIVLEKANKKLERNYKQLKEFCKELLKIE